jgi:uncharacterized protein YndB with AHSA1/START domain
MRTFTDTLIAAARPRAVWKILHDPGRFPEWWAGLASVEEASGTVAAGQAETSFTAFLDESLYQDMDPRRPMVHRVRTVAEEDRVVISCLVADIEYDWRLTPVDDGRGTRIDVTVGVPERVGKRYELQRTIIGASIRRLASLAEDPATG